MKKIIALVLALVLTVAASVAGTVAYLQAEDSDVNVMTLGNVEIEQHEYQRAEGVDHINSATDPAKEGDLVPYENFQPLYPAVPSGNLPYTAEPNDLFYWGYYTGDNGGNGLWDDAKLANVMDKFVFVENTGVSDAYFRTIVAFECPEGMTVGDAGAGDDIGINVNRGFAAGPENNVYIEHEGVRYDVRSFTYGDWNNGVLSPGETARPSLLQVVMNHELENEDVAKFGDTYEIMVLSQAVQTEGFANAAEALDTAFGELNAENAAEWFKGIAIPNEGDPAPANEKVEYNGTEYDDIYAAVAAANANGGGTITMKGSATLDRPVEIASDITIVGNGAAYTRADGYTGTMFTVTGFTLTMEGVILDGDGATATGNLIATGTNGHIMLEEGTVLKNNNGAHAVNLGTRIGATLTLNGAEIINNSSDSGAIWGGGNITINSGKINNNSSTGSAGAIRMVSSCNLTMNGGEICNNTAAANGGAIWGYGASTYNLSGGKISGNAAAVGGGIYTGDSSVVNVSGTFEMTDNTANDVGAMRLSNRTAFNMSGGKISGNTSTNTPNWDGFYGWNPGVNLSGGELGDDITIVGGLMPTIKGVVGDGVIHFELSTNHNTANLADGFTGFKFTVADGGENFANFNLKPAAGYTYTVGDEAKLVCMNEGYSTYWDAASSTFKIKAV